LPNSRRWRSSSLSSSSRPLCIWCTRSASSLEKRRRRTNFQKPRKQPCGDRDLDLPRFRGEVRCWVSVT